MERSTKGRAQLGGQAMLTLECLTTLHTAGLTDCNAWLLELHLPDTVCFQELAGPQLVLVQISLCVKQ